MKDENPMVFQADRGDGEYIKILYSQITDKFYEM
jgi:hypothetical protein